MAGRDRVSPKEFAADEGTGEGALVEAVDPEVADTEAADGASDAVGSHDVGSHDVGSDAVGSHDVGSHDVGSHDVGDGEGEPVPDGVGDDPLKVALAERDEYLDSLRRLQAEFENYRKRVTSQQAEQAARASALLVDKLLPVLDTLDLAVQHLGDTDSADGKALVASSNQLHAVLSKEGLERIDPLGEVFDPNAHEAVGHVPAEDAEGDADADEDGPLPKPVVAQVLRPGYRWKGAVLRPAMVTVRG
jgi:molecular chaperone GrpE